MKRGIRRIKPRVRWPSVSARTSLELLRQALTHATQAGACCTAARIRYAISSAKGAVRAAHMRERT